MPTIIGYFSCEKDYENLVSLDLLKESVPKFCNLSGVELWAQNNSPGLGKFMNGKTMH